MIDVMDVVFSSVDVGGVSEYERPRSIVAQSEQSSVFNSLIGQTDLDYLLKRL